MVCRIIRTLFTTKTTSHRKNCKAIFKPNDQKHMNKLKNKRRKTRFYRPLDEAMEYKKDTRLSWLSLEVQKELFCLEDVQMRL